MPEWKPSLGQITLPSNPSTIPGIGPEPNSALPALKDYISPVELEKVSVWTIEQVAEWLDTIHFSKYKPYFIQNKINGSNLVELNYTGTSLS